MFSRFRFLLHSIRRRNISRIIFPALITSGIFTANSFVAYAQETNASIPSIEGSTAVTDTTDQDKQFADNLAIIMDNTPPSYASQEESVKVDNILYIAGKDMVNVLLDPERDVVVLYGTDRCSTCATFKPILNQVAGLLNDDKVVFVYVNNRTDRVPGFNNHQETYATPNVKIYHRGEDKLIAYNESLQYLDKLNQYNSKLRKDISTNKDMVLSEDTLEYSFKALKTPGLDMGTKLTGKGLTRHLLGFIASNLSTPVDVKALEDKIPQAEQVVFQAVRANIVKECEEDPTFVEDILGGYVACTEHAYDTLASFTLKDPLYLNKYQPIYQKCMMDEQAKNKKDIPVDTTNQSPV